MGARAASAAPAASFIVANPSITCCLRVRYHPATIAGLTRRTTSTVCRLTKQMEWPEPSKADFAC